MSSHEILTHLSSPMRSVFTSNHFEYSTPGLKYGPIVSLSEISFERSASFVAQCCEQSLVLFPAFGLVFVKGFDKPFLQAWAMDFESAQICSNRLITDGKTFCVGVSVTLETFKTMLDRDCFFSERCDKNVMEKLENETAILSDLINRFSWSVRLPKKRYL